MRIKRNEMLSWKKEIRREIQKIQQQIITSGQKNISKKSEGNKKQENLESQSLINCSICDDLYWVAPANQETISANYILCECVKDKVPSVVIHAAKTKLGWNETNNIDITSGNKPINMPVIKFVETDTE